MPSTRYQRLSTVLATAGLLSSCTYITQGYLPGDNRGALHVEKDFFGDTTTRVVYPDQNWDESDSLWFYNTTQGSDLMPYDIFLHLRQAGSDDLFRSNENMRKFRYLTQSKSWDNEDGLPVGWVKDVYRGKDYVGLTCAACHTGQVNYQGTGIRVDGAPAMADMEFMLMELEAALEASLESESFQVLAGDVLGREASSKASLDQFREELEGAYEKIKAYNAMNAPTHAVDNRQFSVNYGYGRLDAFGRIYNRVLYHIAPRDKFEPNPANAPVSYPFLWDTPQHDFVQWNGVGDNGSALGLGPLGRNTGEVIGVFATFEVKEKKPGSGTYNYPSSAKSRNQFRLERHLADLWSPSWPELADRGVLPPIDQALADKGAKVYRTYQCDLCHEDIDRSSPDRRVTAQFTSLELIGTDPFMATNAIGYCGRADYLANADLGMCPGKPNDPYQTSVLPALADVTAGVMKEGLLRKVGLLIHAIIDNPFGVFTNDRTQRQVDLEIANKGFLNAYKGRPLNGIWATAPYLHNGSVANLYELFLPSCEDTEARSGKKCRSNRFTVGNLELDPVKVGFVQPDDPSRYTSPEPFTFDTSLPSNSNAGHEYAVGVTPIPKLQDGKVVRDSEGNIVKEWLPPISDDQRIALVEYLKTL